MAHLSLLRYSIFGMIVACLLIQAEGQFFTKGAKSIPRMGRRSVSERPQQRLNALRRQLIGRLLDEYGPDVAMNMKEGDAARARMIYDQDNSNPERRVLLATSAAAQLEHDPGEVAQRNDQPMDFVKHAMLYNYLKPISVSEERLGDYLQLGSSKSSDESMAKDSLGK